MFQKLIIEDYITNLGYSININYIKKNYNKYCLFIKDFDYHHLYSNDVYKPDPNPLLIIIEFTKHLEYTKKVKRIIDSYDIKSGFLPRDLDVAKISIENIDNYINNYNEPYVCFVRQNTYE